MMQLIINADDFGLNKSCTRAICEAFKKGFITDTTMVANGQAYQEAVDSIQKYGLQKKIGIHFNLTEGVPMTDEIKQYESFCQDGKFHGKINRLKPLSKAEKVVAYNELDAQIRRLEDDEVCITHADSHHHIHTAVFIAPIIIRVCKEHGINRIRLHRNIGNLKYYKRIIKNLFNAWLKCNGFITTKLFGALKDVEETLEKKAVHSLVEVMVHPEYDKHGVLIDKEKSGTEGAIGKKMYSLAEVDNSITIFSYYEV